jgi:hypothetical protein
VQAISSAVEDRPSTCAVKHMVEEALLESREQRDSATAPLWEAVRLLQGSLQEQQGALHRAASGIAALQQEQVGVARWIGCTGCGCMVSCTCRLRTLFGRHPPPRHEHQVGWPFWRLPGLGPSIRGARA